MKSALQGFIILLSVKATNSRLELALRGRCGSVGTVVLCSKMLCLTECYDKAAVILSATRPYDVSNALLQYRNPLILSLHILNKRNLFCRVILNYFRG